MSVAVDVTQDPYCLPEPYTLPQNIDTLPFIQGTEPTQTCTDADVAAQSVIGAVGDRPVAGAATSLLERGGLLRGGASCRPRRSRRAP